MPRIITNAAHANRAEAMPCPGLSAGRRPGTLAGWPGAKRHGAAWKRHPLAYKTQEAHPRDAASAGAAAMQD